MRLIDAELTAKNIARHRIYTLEVGNDEMNKMMEGYNPSAFSAGFDYGMDLAMKLVSSQPTAYDKDKVVEQLEERRKSYRFDAIVELGENGHTLDFEFMQGKICGVLDAIEIVKECR